MQNMRHFAVQGHSRSPILVPIESKVHINDFPLVINTNLPYLRFGDTAFQISEIALFGQGIKRRRKFADNLNRLSRVLERYRQTDDRETTDGRVIAYIASVN